MKGKQYTELLQAARSIEAADAAEADELAFMARLLVQTTLPHSDPGDVKAFERVNGDVRLFVQPGPATGIPYGSYPRLILAWLTAEAIRTRSPRVVLGDSLSGFMRELGIVPTGGRWGSIRQLREQMRRLFAARVAALQAGQDVERMASMEVATGYELWWTPRDPDQAAMWESTVTLGDSFFREIMAHPVPLDMRALRALRRSPLGLDLYAWLVHRMGYLKASVFIPWAMLLGQFGADYANPKDAKRKIRRELGKIALVWPSLRVSYARGGLTLHPSPTHVSRALASSAAPDGIPSRGNAEVLEPEALAPPSKARRKRPSKPFGGGGQPGG
ncbi:MAG: pirin [Rhodothermales bacterium]|nr:pirin [Rhodothermales bacterium]